MRASIISSSACALLAICSQALVAPDVQAADQVWCHQPKIKFVRRVARSQCAGKIVSDEEARRIKQARVKRIKRVLKREDDPLVPGKQLHGTGTGFFVSRDGHVLTNNHVIQHCSTVTVTPPGAEPIVAKLIASAPKADLAILQSSRRGGRAASFRPSFAKDRREQASVVGYPLHGKVVIKPQMISGSVTPRPRQIKGSQHLLALNMDIRRGHSGGPVLDNAGRVIGVVFAKLDTPSTFKKTGKVIKNVGLAIRSTVVQKFLKHHNLTPQVSKLERSLSPPKRFKRAIEFIVQIGCWK